MTSLRCAGALCELVGAASFVAATTASDALLSAIADLLAAQAPAQIRCILGHQPEQQPPEQPERAELAAAFGWVSADPLP